MPIRREFRKFYGRTWREVIRPRILARAHHRCEECGKPNGRAVFVYECRGTGVFAGRRVQYWLLEGGAIWRDSTGARVPRSSWPAPGLPRRIRVQIGIAHRNHTPGDDRDANLVALCNWCHLHQDAQEHKRTRSARKDRARPLLAELTC